MHVKDVICTATQPGAVYFLLSAYIEAIANDPISRAIPEWSLPWPVSDTQSVRDGLVVIGYAWIHQAATTAERQKLSEALDVFRAALGRLDELAAPTPAQRAHTIPCAA